MRNYIVFTRLWSILFVVVGSMFVTEAIAQQTATYYHEDADYREGLDLFDKAKYGPAQKKFDETIQRIQDPSDEVQVNAEYYKALCALELFNKDAEYLLSEFIRTHPESPRVRTAYFQLGRYQYRRKKYEKAIDWFNKVDEYDLSHEELSEFYFKRGYCYFDLEKYESASKDFFEIKEVENQYRDPANYYYSHIAYKNGKYQTALQGFRRLQSHPSFGQIVPYYIAQIHFLQKHYDELIAYAVPMLDTAKVKREAEIARIIGEAYYNTDRYVDAIPFLERYHRKSHLITREDNYQLGYAYYKGKNYKGAIKTFNLVLTKKDALAQTTYYHIGDCYLKEDMKTNSRSAFREASKLKFDPEIEENALYNYAKLSYELSYNPYHEAIKAFEEYIAKYPNSSKIDEAYEYLVNVYLTTRNYKKALESLDKIPNKDLRLQTAYQMVAFNSGIEQFINRDFNGAIQSMKMVGIYPIDANMTVEAVYWQAEAFYRLGDYDKAIATYKAYRAQPRAILNRYFKVSNYNLGYANFKKKDYAASIPYFRSFVDVVGTTDEKKKNDAYLRLGDSYFIARDFSNAVDYYEKGIQIKQADTDYALFQKAFCQGLLQDHTGKIATLKLLVDGHKKSVYMADALYELGESYRVKGNLNDALTYYQRVETEYPNSFKVKKAQLNRGLIYYKQGNSKAAIQIFEQIARQSKTYDQAKDALITLENIRVERGEIKEWQDLLSQLSYVDFSRGKLDTTTYRAAENLYFASNWDKAIVSFNDYLREFNPAIFAVNAHYYKGTAHYQKGQLNQAVAEFNAVIAAAPNKFYEEALMSHARISYDKEDWQAAVGSFMSIENVGENKDYVLEAMIGQMRCFKNLDNCTAAIDAAGKVLLNNHASEDIRVEAEMIIARCYYDMDMQAQAIEQCEKVVKMTRAEYSAEAQYYIAHILHKQGKYAESDEAIYELVKQVPSYDYWIAMGYLMIVENSIATEDYFQAKATLQSIIDNYNGTKRAEILQKAQARLDYVMELESAGQGEKRREDVEIELDGFEPGQEELFDEDGEKEKKRKKGNGDDTGDAQGGQPEGTEGQNTEGGGQ